MKFSTIGVITKQESESARLTLQSLCDYLGRKHCTVIIDRNSPDITDNCGFTREGRDVISQRCDLVIVIGGDGTILDAVRSLAYADVPILGINVGRLGFLADISPKDIEATLDEVLRGSYIEEQRLLLEMQVMRDNKVIFEGDAFNDVVVHIRDIARMIEFEMRINDEFVNHQRADGIVISTPTGSTAYALSSGGPILCATLDVLALVPISPHTLSSRPLVVNADAQINILICNTKDGIAQATCDGQLSIDVLVGDHIKVRRKQKKITLLHPKHYNYFEILRAKLHWSEHT